MCRGTQRGHLRAEECKLGTTLVLFGEFEDGFEKIGDAQRPKMITINLDALVRPRPMAESGCNEVYLDDDNQKVGDYAHFDGDTRNGGSVKPHGMMVGDVERKRRAKDSDSLDVSPKGR